MSLLNHLPHLATAKQRTRTKDSIGGTKDSYSTVLFTNKACWRQPVSDRESVDYLQRGQDVSHKIYFAEDPGVDERCVLVIGGETHSVRSVSHQDASVGLGVLWRVMVELEP